MTSDDTAGTFAVIAGGGTAGHLLPGLAVAEALVERGHDRSTIHFVGGDRGVEQALVPPAGFGLDELPGRGIQRRLTLANARAAWGLLRGLAAGMRIIGRRRPKVVVVLGGYASLACGVGAVLRRVPLVLLEQNARAGAVNRLLRHWAAVSLVSFDGTDLPRSVTVGNPLRPEIASAAEHPDRASARRVLGLPDDRTVVGVYSGSLGARQINEAVRGLVGLWAERSDLAIRHVVGRRDFATFEGSGRDSVDGLLYQVVEYEERMDLLLQAADVVVSRSGGGVAEAAALGVPAILVPLPGAPRDHQRANAEHLVEAGGARLLDNSACTAERLARELEALLGPPSSLPAMADAMRSASHLDAAERAAAIIEEQARG